MSLYGSTIPLGNGTFVVTVVCPNHYSQQRLMSALNEIVPSAGEPGSVPLASMYARMVAMSEQPSTEVISPVTAQAFAPIAQFDDDSMGEAEPPREVSDAEWARRLKAHMEEVHSLGEMYSRQQVSQRDEE